jgi:hypothetical protein
MKKLRYISLGTALVLVLASLVFKSSQITLSVAAGALIVVISYELLCLIVSRMFEKGKKSAVPLIFIALIKLLIISLLIWFLVTSINVNIIALLVGLSTILLATVIYSISEYI